MNVDVGQFTHAGWLGASVGLACLDCGALVPAYPAEHQQRHKLWHDGLDGILQALAVAVNEASTPS